MGFEYLDRVEFKKNYTSGEQTFGDQYEVMDFYLENVKCPRCLSKVEGVAGTVEGVRGIQLNLGNNVARVEMNAGGHFSRVAEQWEALGFIPHPIHSRSDISVRRKEENRACLNRVGVSGVVTGNIMLFSVAIYSGTDPVWSQYFDLICGVLFLAILLYCSRPFYSSALAAIKARSASIDLPIALSILVGAGVSYLNLFRDVGDVYFDSISMLVFLILTSRYILSLFQQSLLAPSYFKEFFKLDKIYRVKEQKKEIISPEEIQVNDRLHLNENDVFPADSILLKDNVWVDSSVVSGEFLPDLRHHSEKVFAGEKCLTEDVEVCALSTARGSRLGQLIDEVEEQLLKKTPLISLTDKVAQYFTLFILALGSAFFLFYMSVDLNEAINRSLALVILACPCALAFATPLSQSLSLSKLAKSGLLVKKAETLEKINHIDTVLFDKTGTLSKGQLSFLGWHGEEPNDLEKSIIYSLEEKSKHPVGRAFRYTLSSFSGKTVPIEDWSEVPGEGVRGCYQGQEYSIKVAPEQQFVSGNRCIGLYKEKNCIAVAKFNDIEKEDSKKTLSNIVDLGLETFIISGDSESSVKAFSNRLGVANERVFYKMSPKDKEDFVKKHPSSIMVGDGANDLLALTGSHVSVAVKGSMEASLRVADVYVTRDGVAGVSDLIHVSRESMKVIKRNLVVSAIYNFVGAMAALLGFINPLVAAILMPLSTTVVVLLTIYGTQWLRAFSYEMKTIELVS